MKTRRQFITDLGAAVVTATIAPTALLANPNTTRTGTQLSKPVPALDYATFKRLVRTPFRVQPEFTNSLGLVLTKAQAQSPAAGGECFSLTFRGPTDRVLDQNTYTFEHEELGGFEMFIVPGSRDQKGQMYNATFNRCV